MNSGRAPAETGCRPADGAAGVSAVPASIPRAIELRERIGGLLGKIIADGIQRLIVEDRDPTEDWLRMQANRVMGLLGDYWQPIEHFDATTMDRRQLVCGGTIFYDAEFDPTARPFKGVAIAEWTKSGEWEGDYGSEYDAKYWHSPAFFMPVPMPASAIEARSGSTEGESAVPQGDAQ